MSSPASLDDGYYEGEVHGRLEVTNALVCTFLDDASRAHCLRQFVESSEEELIIVGMWAPRTHFIFVCFFDDSQIL